MKTNNDTPYKYSVIDNVNYVVEECGNRFTALRKIQWAGSNKVYVDIRRWEKKPDGSEMAAKGCTFMTEEGPCELVNALIDAGYGNTREIVSHLSNRSDFRSAVNSVVDKDDPLYDKEAAEEETKGYYNAKDLLDNFGG